MNYGGRVPWSFSPSLNRTSLSAQRTDLSSGRDPSHSSAEQAQSLDGITSNSCGGNDCLCQESPWERCVLHVCPLAHTHTQTDTHAHWSRSELSSSVLLSGVKSRLPRVPLVHVPSLFPAAVSQILPWILTFSDVSRFLPPFACFSINPLKPVRGS